MSLKGLQRFWLRRIVLSMRSLLGLVLIAGLVFGFTVIRARRQRDAVLAIRNLGGQVRYSKAAALDFILNPLMPGVSNRIAAIVGPDFIYRIEYVELGSDTLAEKHDQIFQLLGDVNGVDTLNLIGRGIHDGHLKWLTNLDVRTLLLQGCAVTDRGLATLRRLPNLVSLFVSNAAVSDEGMSHIGQLRQLKELTLADTNVTDDGLIALQKSANLQNLQLQGAGFSNRALKFIASVRSLKNLTFVGTSIDGRQIAELSRLPNLASLVMHRSDFRESSPEGFGSLRTVRSLELNGCYMSEDWVGILESRLPNAKVTVRNSRY
jgi:hypothetical protein